MIKSWHLENFKSVREKTSLDFAPLTIFSGPNNSGKSTIIQSILLTAQTLQSRVLDRPVLLNGHLVRLGSFLDIVSDACPEKNVSIGFSLELKAPRGYFFYGRGILPRKSGLSTFAENGKSRIGCNFSFSMKGDSEEVQARILQPRLEQTTLKVEIPGIKETPNLTLKRTNKNIEKRLLELGLDENLSGTLGVETLKYKLVNGKNFVDSEADLFAKKKIAGIGLKHFLPDHLMIAFDNVETVVEVLINSFTGTTSPYRNWLFKEIRDNLENPEVKRITFEVFDQIVPEIRKGEKRNIRKPWVFQKEIDRMKKNIQEKKSLLEILELSRSLSPSMRGALGQLFLERKTDLEKAVTKGEPQNKLAEVPLSAEIEFGKRNLQEFFLRSVNYLGPLRNEPQAVHPLTASIDPIDVGFKGEHTAAVLERNGHKSINYIRPIYFERKIPKSIPVDTNQLKNAVQDWLRYMEVGEQIKTEDRGKLGYELKVGTETSSIMHDLTQVGVGVSQVLPILVVSLLSKEGDVLIFEQPELHLHPKVQTRLADFFISLTLMNKQCIVETHSEHFINQLRYCSVLAEDASVADSVQIYFVEKKGGQSTYRSIKMNEFGVIEQWPKGFFDEREKTASGIMRAAMEKKRKKNEGRGE